jgi:peptidoglycan hydrolase-like protein with peptidoglycan-binding domain
LTRGRILLAIAGAAAAVALVATACTGGGADRPAAVKARVTRSTSTTSSSTTTTSSTTPPPPAPVGLRMGASGPEVLALQQKLASLKYDVAADGRFGPGTAQAVLAFQKVEGLGRDGVAGPQTMGRLATAGVPGPMVPSGGAKRVEVDVARQVLFYFEGGALQKIVAVSTGNGERFCVDGRCATAVTPGGSFRVRGKVSGWQTGKLGRLYKPSYFNGNIAIHGALSVPAGPASHGCVRVPMSSADWIYAALSPGTPVYVLNGPKAPVPFGDSAPPSLKPDANQAPGDVVPMPPAPPPTSPSTHPPVIGTNPPPTSSSTTTTTTTTTPTPPST